MSSTNQQKKKQDEKNSKLIRELAALPANKYCFECGQRGPTYVNITNGSFCCMHCSGILRGLNPPHRVKSISMATFSNEEIEKLKSMGNEENAKIWLGLHDGPIKFEPVRLDENVKQHLIQKYERKRWFVSPSEIAEQKRLLEAHSRRDSTSAISINSHKSNQSAPANLQPEKKNDLIDILGEDLMFPVKEEPANTTQNTVSSSTFSSSLNSSTATGAPSFFPPPNLFSSSTNNPLSSHSNTPQPLQFDLFGAPPPVAKVSSPPAIQRQQQQPPSHQNTFDFFGPPQPTAAPVTSQQPKAQDNFANFDAVFNSFSISEKPAPPVIPQIQPVSNGFLSSTPNIQSSVLEPVMQSQPFESSLKPEPPKEIKKDDGLPDYSALEALYHAEDEPVDFFGFGKASNNTQHNQTSAATLSATTAANGFAKSKTTDFGYQSPFPSSNNFGTPNISSTNATGLTPNPFFSMNNFQPSSFSQQQQTMASSNSSWLPSTTTTTASNGATAGAAASSSINAHQRPDWNPFQ